MLRQPLANRLKVLVRQSEALQNDFRFFKGWLKGPSEVGSIRPTGPIASRRMASLVDPFNPLPVLELGPGTGPITKAILDRGLAPEKLVSVEYSREFVAHLQKSFPGVRFVEGDAFNLAQTLGDAGLDHLKFQATVSGLPLLLVPKAKRVALITDCLSRMAPGSPFVQFSYGPKPPVRAAAGNFSVRHLDTVFRNVPPARLWIYSTENA